MLFDEQNRQELDIKYFVKKYGSRLNEDEIRKIYREANEKFGNVTVKKYVLIFVFQEAEKMIKERIMNKNSE